MTPRTWFITGASKGFGREWAMAALERGDSVAATARDVSTLIDLEELFGDQVMAIQLDVTDRDAVFDAVRRAHAQLGRLDVIVNNAGYGQFGMVEELSEADARDQIETNLFGALWVTQAALPFLRAQHSGHILQVSSIGGITAFPGIGMYHASKWALEGLSQALAAEVASFGIRVTIIEPTGYATDWAGPSSRTATPLPAYDEVREENAERMAARRARPGDPDGDAGGDPGRRRRGRAAVADLPRGRPARPGRGRLPVAAGDLARVGAGLGGGPRQRGVSEGPSGSEAGVVADLLDRIPAALEAVRPHVVRTPLVRLERADGSAAVQVKCEHLQRTGSFKARGAIAKLSALGAEQRERGVVAASSGNHGLGVAYALSVLGGRGLVCVPESASPVKVAAIRRLGVEVRHLGEESGRTETLTREYAAEHGLAYVSPYNDLDVVAGQATVGVELAEQTSGEGLDTVVVAVGGGGLVSGVAAAVRAARPGVRVVGASPANDAAMAAAVAAGHVVPAPARPTVSDGTAGGIEADAVTLDLCRRLVDEWVLVEEDRIAAAMRLMIDTHHQLVEGAAGVALAAGLDVAARHPDRHVAVVSCGANISTDTLLAALDGAYS